MKSTSKTVYVCKNPFGVLLDKNLSWKYNFLQEEVVKAFAFEHDTSRSIPIFSGLKILTLQYLSQLKLLCFVYDCVNKDSPLCFHISFESVTNVRQYGMVTHKKWDFLDLKKIVCNMASGLCNSLVPNLWTTFKLI